MKVLKHHRTIGIEAGRGEIVNGTRREMVILQTAPGTSFETFPADLLLPAEPTDIETTITIDLVEVLERAAFLGLDLSQMRAAFDKAAGLVVAE